MFPGAALTNQHKLVGLKQQEIFSQFSKAEASGEEPSLPLTALVAHGILWLMAMSLKSLLFSHGAYPLCVCVSNLPVFVL